MPRRLVSLLLLVLAPGLVPIVSWAQPVELTSPNGAVAATVTVDGQNQLRITVRHDGATVIEPSPLGVVLEGRTLGRQVQSTEPSEVILHTQEYPTRGNHTTATGRYRAQTLRVRRVSEGDGAQPDPWALELRAYNDGVAYRYRFPPLGPVPTGRREASWHTVRGEVSAWTLPERTTVWYQTDVHNYEGLWQSAPVDSVSTDLGPPVVAELPGGGYALISEANPYGYSGMTLSSAAGRRTLRSTFLDDSTWAVPGGDASPWRFVMLSDDLDGLVNSDLVTNLNPPPDSSLYPKGARTEWVDPGRSVWRWWSRGTGTPEQERQYIDYAARLGFEYTLVDVDWEGWDNKWGTMENLVDYGHERGVEVWLWKSWSTGPLRLTDPLQRQVFFAKVAETGAVGVKIDYMNSESQDRLRFYQRVLVDAAHHDLMINFHGANKSDGSTRTYPNEMTREGLAGLEKSPVPPSHNAALPFTRGAVGAVDYTPVTFDSTQLGATTFAHQLATAYSFTSPVTHWADHPPRYFHVEKALDLIKATPATWDETVVLPPSEIGALSVIARRTGETWFLAVLNGREAPRTLDSVPLDFLGDGTYRLVTLSDETQTSMARNQRTGVDRNETLEVSLLPGGGFVGWFRPEADPGPPQR
ncbi:MAG: glycoside hydrolase family 97 catalytic domain-containing protein [Salinivenus sp.]